MKFYILVFKQIVKDWLISWVLWRKIRKKIYIQCSQKMYRIPHNGIWALFETLDMEVIIALSKRCSLSQWEVEKILLFSGHPYKQHLDHEKDTVGQVKENGQNIDFRIRVN